MTHPPVYLDNAATSFPKPEAVCRAVDDYLRNCGASFGRGTHGAEHAEPLVTRCRSRIAELIGAPDYRTVAFTFNGTDGLNLLLRGFLRPGHHVITTTLEHNSVLRPLEQLRAQLPVTVDHIAFDPFTGTVDPGRFEEALRKRSPDLVVLNHASNVTGIVQPVAELGRLARATGARVLLDASQSVGHLDVNAAALGADMLAAPGHKGLLGPLGTGFVYLHPDLHEGFISLRCGGTGTHSESLRQPCEMPHLLESGNLNMPGIAGLNAALEWLNSDEVADRRATWTELCEQLRHRLAQISGVDVLCIDSTCDHTGVLSFTVGKNDSHEVATILSQTFSIQCRAGLHCAPLAHRTMQTQERGGTVRLSPGLFSTAEDVDLAMSAMNAIAESLM